MRSYNITSRILFVTYIIVFFSLFLYSFTQIDLGLVISRYPFFYHIEKTFQYIGYFNRPLSTLLYLIILFSLGILYGVSLKLAAEKKIGKRFIWKILITAVILLVFSYSAFSYDIFNYIFDAKIFTHYHANPYIHKALDYPGDPMLAFMHWAHRVYPYGPVWLAFTIPLSFAGLQIFLLTFFLFKSLMAACYLGSLYFIGKIFQKIRKEKELFGLVFFGLNPLVLIECLVSPHLDIVMMCFSLFSFYLLLHQKTALSGISLLFSIGIKFLTVLTIPLIVIAGFMLQIKKKINWDLLFGITLVLLVFGVFFETRQSGNFQPWYLIALLSYSVFLSDKYFIFIPSVIISLLSLTLYIPYLYLGNWNPPVPQVLFGIMLASYGISFITVCVITVSKKRKHDKK